MNFLDNSEMDLNGFEEDERKSEMGEGRNYGFGWAGGNSEGNERMVLMRFGEGRDGSEVGGRDSSKEGVINKSGRQI